MPSTPQTNSRRPLVVANWKMNKTIDEAEAFAKKFVTGLASKATVETAICPPFTALVAVKKIIDGTPVRLGAQNVNDNENGAFTGEISGAMLVSIGCTYVVIGHSERRQFYGETDELVNKKIKIAFKHKLIPIVCVGETLAEREAAKTLDVVSRQIQGALMGLPSAETQQLVIAYEPIWAIGTGRTATPTQAQEVHLAIRNILKDQYGSLTSLQVRILYGGSVKPDNMSELMACEDVDGGLVGGASLDADSFLKIVNYSTNKLTNA